MEHASRKELAAAYKTKKQVGGVYCIVNDTDGRCLLKYTADLAGAKNRFDFAKATGRSTEIKLTDYWGDGSSFSFSVVDTLEKKEDWDDKRFIREVRLLAEIWKENLDKNWY
ncbi:MAG: GIY-YIG nuclease family protein [Clostridiales bacterium]|mgnify:FL=1|nr:GIY-YIG nuclease family protein [Clostridiales bacterium]